MITQQLESLRKLADAFEECEAKGVTFGIGDRSVEIFYGKRGVWIELDSLAARTLRRTISGFTAGESK